MAYYSPMPRKLRQLIKDIADSNFRLVAGEGKGSHRKFVHRQFPEVTVMLSGQDGHDAHHYQEKHIRERIAEAARLKKESERSGQ